MPPFISLRAEWLRLARKSPADPRVLDRLKEEIGDLEREVWSVGVDDVRLKTIEDRRSVLARNGVCIA